MKIERCGLMALALIGFILGIATTAYQPAWGFGATKEIAAGKILCIDPTWQGNTEFAATLYFTGYSRSGTGGINDFSSVRLGAGATHPRLGFTCDTLGEEMTVTAINALSITYTLSGAASSRVWCPDLHEPNTVTGGITTSWDDVNQVVTVNTLGAALITMTWSTAATSVDLPSFYTAFSLLSLIPILLGAVVIVGIIGGGMSGEQAAQIAMMMAVFAITGIIAVYVFTTIAAAL